jgi:hypothetical protein
LIWLITITKREVSSYKSSGVRVKFYAFYRHA